MPSKIVTGGFAEAASGMYYKIENTQEMSAFFINLVTSSDLWMFLSSNGALTAGRQNSQGVMFPYETDDRLHMASATGPKTIIRFSDGRIWEPFDTGHDNPFTIRRNLYKRLTGDSVIFEEINESLGLAFSYRWETCEKYGIVRTARLQNLTDNSMEMEVLDGFLNIFPYGIPQSLADNYSCLADAYKASELVDDSGLAVYSLTSLIIDTPEPVEVLRATTVLRIGDKPSAYLLSAKQIGDFCAGTVQSETRSAGCKGAYLTVNRYSINANSDTEWMLIMDACRSQKNVSALLCATKNLNELKKAVEKDIADGTAELVRIVAAADGLQHTADVRATTRHYMNVLYNNMRGGIFLDGYDYDFDLFEKFIQKRSPVVFLRCKDFLDDVRKSGNKSIIYLHEKAYAGGDLDLIRLCLEFFPLTFSRRHGDPSRPWNRFNINVKDDNGNRTYHYEGNWRDIFQNWEAMSLSFPEYIEPIIIKFFNASTADGFNPYRISEDGIDWEMPERHNPYDGFGYWGDHQIVYLNKLLEWLNAYAPSRLARLMEKSIFTYANVPYEIKPYSSLVKNAKDTLIFNFEKNEKILKLCEQRGADGKLLMDGEAVYHVSFIEKLLVSILAKISNLIPGGGIWMNTQRPEWNDANNAIVGNGLSMVTVYQLYRHLLCCRKIIERFIKDKNAAFDISKEVLVWLDDISAAIDQYNKNKTARQYLDEAGTAFERYRTNIYTKGFSGKTNLSAQNLFAFFDTVLNLLTAAIDANKRDDGLYNSYNLLQLTEDSLCVSSMFLMLEGQTAVLGSGRLAPEDALSLVNAMENSGLYSQEHKTFYLYPIKKLKTFMEKNIIPPQAASSSGLIKALLENENGLKANLVMKDANGNVRFHDSITQTADLEKAIARLQADKSFADLAQRETGLVHEIYEQVFLHKQFTGRSGIMYKYEGIGSIYWHQNSKFILSFQEYFSRMVNNPAQDKNQLKHFKDVYYSLRSGLGFNKEPSLWGAFPLEPYSHTPFNMPAQQPGMTGQVKEDILTRFAELGVFARDGILSFNPLLLKKEELLQQQSSFKYIAANGEVRELPLEKDTLGFTVCQVPVIYRAAKENKITVYTKNKEQWSNTLLALDSSLSRSLFSRDGTIELIEVDFSQDYI